MDDQLYQFKDTKPFPCWHWRENKHYNAYNKSTSEVIEIAYQTYLKESSPGTVTLGLMSVNFVTMQSRTATASKAKKIIRGMWFYNSDEKNYYCPYEDEIANNLECILQTDPLQFMKNRGGVVVSEKPLRMVEYCGNGVFKQFRKTKNANLAGRCVHRGWMNSTLKEGREYYLTFSTAPRVISGVISPRNTPNQQENELLNIDGLHKYYPEDLHRELPAIAKGSYGIVYRGKVKDKDELVVIKDMHIRDEKSMEEWAREIKTMMKFKSPYVVETYGFSSYENVLTIIMEYVKLGDLFTIIHKKKIPFSSLQIVSMARQFITGLELLHKNRVLHRDIKSMNILVTENYFCKLTDFGMAKLITSDENIWNTANAGTPLWMAPEVRAAGPYLYPADIYSAGLVLFEIFEQILPEWDRKNCCVNLPEHFKSSEVVLPCLCNEPDKRLNASGVLKNLDAVFVDPILLKLSKKFPKEVLKKKEINVVRPEKEIELEHWKEVVNRLKIPKEDIDEIVFPKKKPEHVISRNEEKIILNITNPPDVKPEPVILPSTPPSDKLLINIPNPSEETKKSRNLASPKSLSRSKTHM